MSTARDEILARIRGTSHSMPASSPPPAYRRTSTLTAEERVARFCDRVADYRAEVKRLPIGGVADEIDASLSAHAATRMGIPPGLPASWRPSNVELMTDDGMSVDELDGLDGVLTGCTVAISETGTIVLSAGPTEGRRALTLVPDLHICVVREAQIVGLVPEAITRLGELVSAERRPLTLISGPSATSDIELSRVEGVHGPRTLVVLVTSEEPS